MTTTPLPTLSVLQREALETIITVFTKAQPRVKEFRLGGYAGTGKTTLLKHIKDALVELAFDVAVVAPTGKAAKVLSSKGLFATTIHRLIYDSGPTAGSKGWTLREKLHGVSFIICDEASMVDRKLYTDLLSFKYPILWVGDPGQLEPVGNDIRLMVDPDFTLTEVFRQALDNPILAFATHIRAGKVPTIGQDPKTGIIPNLDPTRLLRSFRSKHKPSFGSFDQIIVGKNTTRRGLNKSIRESLGRPSHEPEVGDKLIVLKNNYQLGLVNGETLTIEALNRIGTFNLRTDEGLLLEDVTLDLTVYHTGEVPKFVDPDVLLTDFGYAITCHKSQGSEWDRVLVLDEAFGDELRRWRYTAITRARKHLTYLL